MIYSDLTNCTFTTEKDMFPKNVLFVRHAQSIGNVMTYDERALHTIHNRAYPLTHAGKLQASLTGKYLKDRLRDNLPDMYFHSTFLRTKMTMEILLEVCGKRKTPSFWERVICLSRSNAIRTGARPLYGICCSRPPEKRTLSRKVHLPLGIVVHFVSL